MNSIEETLEAYAAILGRDRSQTKARRLDFAEFRLNCTTDLMARTEYSQAIGYCATKIRLLSCLWAGSGRACNRYCRQHRNP